MKVGKNFHRNLYDSQAGGADQTLDRSFEYDHVGRINWAYTGSEATAHAITGQWGQGSGPYAHAHFYDAWGNLTQRMGNGGWNPSASNTYTNNRNNAHQYDLAGNVTSDGSALGYDATGQQVSSVNAGQWDMGYAYDGDRLRVRKDENGQTTYYLRSSVLGGQVTAEVNAAGQWVRGHVYLGAQALAVQEDGAVSWVHEDPVTKTKKRTNASGTVTSSTLVDPWGGEVTGAWVQNAPQQKRKFTTYERGADDRDEAQHRGYSARASRFDQPDPYDGSYDLTNPQSLNRYAYVNNDPVNFVDPSGLNMAGGGGGWRCSGTWSAERTSEGQIVNFRITSINCASWGSGGGPQNPVPYDINGIRNGLKDALKNPDCSGIVNSLLNAVATNKNPLVKNGDIMAMFEAVVSGKGGFTRDQPPGSAGYGNPTGNIAKGNATIYLIGAPNFTPAQQLASDIDGTLGELMHLAGSKQLYTDRTFAEKVYANYPGLSRAPWPGNKNYKFYKDAAKNPNHGGWSSYFHDAVRRKCFGK